MRACLLIFATLLPLSALAQLQVFQFDGTNDTPVGSLVNVGAAAPGDTLKTRFHVRNIGSGSSALTTLSLAGQGFSFASAPSLPYTLAPYTGPASEVEFDIDFTPSIAGSLSAFLAVNNLNIVLQGTAAGGATVSLSGSQTALTAGAVVNFGSVAVGASQSQGFVLSNPSSSSLTVQSVVVSGAAFQLVPGLKLPVQIAPGQTATFQVTFTPSSPSADQGTLAIDGRSFNLTGQGLAPALPSVSLVLASTVGASAQQNSISISLDSASQTTGTGTLAMAFESSVPGVTDDPAIQFLSGPQRTATVNIAIGATLATIGGQSSMPFQTGTTAGTLTFTLSLGNGTHQQISLVIPGSTVVIDSVTAVRQLGALNVAFSGFDNTYSASQLAFTFYDLTGKALPQGAINVNAATAFQQYFSSTQAGGAFQLLATFPVTGDTSQIGYVTAQFTNSAGSTTAQQIAIGN